jgi:hypothetical protein
MSKFPYATAASLLLLVLGACAHPADSVDSRSSVSSGRASASSGPAASSSSRSGVEFYGTLDVGIGSQHISR